MGEFFLGMMEITIGMSILILLMLFTLKLIGGKFTAKCRYILWTLVLLRLAVPVSFGILPALIEFPVETEPEPQIQMQTVPNPETIPVQPHNPVPVQPQEQVQIPTPTVQTPVFTEPEPDPLTWEDVKAYIPHAYLAGVTVFLLWNLLAYGIYTAKILRSARESDDEPKAIYEAVCRKKGLRRVPKLLVSPDVNSPAAFGLLFRRIVLPDIELTENGLTGTLSHEVTHCKRGDLWIKAVCLLARSFHWFNPLVHLAAFRCEMEMELSCDEAVLIGCDENTRAAYGEVMLDIIKRCRRNRGALTTHFNPRKNAVKARFANILYGSGKRKGLWLIAVCLILCLVAGAIVACRTENVNEKETQSEAEEKSEVSSQEQDNEVSSPLINILSQNSALQVHTVYITVEGENPYYDTWRLDDRHTIFQTYDRTDRWAEEWIADNIMLWVVDALTGTIAASFNVDDERILNEISYTDTGCVLYRWENRNGIIVARYAVQIENNNGTFTFTETEIDAYPQKLNYIRTPDGTASAYRTVEDIEGNHGIDVQYPDGSVKRILNGEIGSVQSTVRYRPIAFLDGSRLVYSVLGGKYHISFGIYNIVTHENMLMDGAYSCLGVHDGVVYAAYENGGDFNYGIYESELWAIYADGTKNMLAATHNVTDGITALSMEEYYLFKNGMWVFYETGDISGYGYYDDPSKKLKVRLVSPDMQTTLLEAEYPYIYDCTGLLMTCGDSVTIAVPVTTKKTMNTGTYPTVEAYINDRMAQESTITYYSVSRHHANPDGGADEWTATANVVDTKLVMFEKKGELDGLAADGVLECWEYRYHLKLDVPTDDVMTVDGDFEGWFDMVGQHTVVALRYPNGTYSILMDEMTGDGIDFGGYHDTYEEAIYDWYVTEYGLDLPLYVEDWTDEITTPNGEYIGNHPVHRFDGDGWGIYIPVAAWYRSPDVMENQWLWCSSYLTGSALLVEAFSDTLETETPENTQTNGTYSFTYHYDNPNGGFWRVTISWTDEGVSSENPNIVIEPQLLKLMAESFVVFEDTYSRIPTSPTVENYSNADTETIWLNFLDTVVSPYSDYVVATEFLDLDGNSIDELLIYNWGASANCGIEIFTIENGKVRSFSTTTNAITHYSGEPKSLAPPSANAVNYSFWGLPTSYSDRSDTILWFTPCTGRNGHVLYSMNGSDVHTSEDYYYFTSDANGNLTVEVLRSFRCEAIDSNPANGWKCYINGEETNVRGFRDTMLFFWQDLAVTHGVQYHDKNTASRYDELEAWMEPSLDVGALLEKNLAELRQMEGNQYRAIEAILSQNSSMLEEAMKLPEWTGQMFTGITLASWAVDRISDDRYFNPIRLTLEITESSSSVFPVGTSRWIVDEGMDGVTLTNYENNEQ